MKEFKQEKQKATRITIFPIPYSFENIPRSINLTPNSISKPSKEKLIAEAFHYHSRGNISEALKYYHTFVTQGYKNHLVFSNYGGLLSDLGKFKEAEVYLLKAIELNPSFENAYLNLGNILSNLGKLNEALISYLKVIEINPNHSLIYYITSIFLRDSDPTQLNRHNLKNIFDILIERNDINHQHLTKAFNLLYSNKLINDLKILNSNNSQIQLNLNKELIIKVLKKIILKDIKIEKMLTKLRKNLCSKVAKNKKNIVELELIIGLAEQCYLNEYVYSLTEEDKIFLEKIQSHTKEGEVNETNISMLACYFPLYKILNQIHCLKTFNSLNRSFKNLIRIQLTEPIAEIELAKSIEKVGLINNDISKKVRSQYEENPYPRWINTYNLIKQKEIISQAINNEIKPNIINDHIGDKEINILVAGCGTGQNILNIQNYNNSRITGIDLSLASLSYAKRKINEHKIDNVKLIHMDLLEIGLLEEEFDIILCSGVLHHMEDPKKAIKVLLKNLKNNGFIKFGLYSELARQNIVSARKYIAKQQLKSNDIGIRDFRERVMSGKLKELSSLITHGDFYSLSECRDLCFHAQEHRFTINQLYEILKSNELKFLGFLLPQAIKNLYQNYFPEDKQQTNLQNWAKFEEKHPTTFAGMYQFWVCKTEN